MSDDQGPKGCHNVGGDQAGDIPMIKLPWLHWQKQVEDEAGSIEAQNIVDALPRVLIGGARDV
jgi:hypothetical protein